MTIKDIQLLTKKIIVGIVLFAIPALVISGGLYLTNKLLQKPATGAINKEKHPENTQLP